MTGCLPHRATPLPPPAEVGPLAFDGPQASAGFGRSALQQRLSPLLQPERSEGSPAARELAFRHARQACGGLELHGLVLAPCQLRRARWGRSGKRGLGRCLLLPSVRGCAPDRRRRDWWRQRRCAYVNAVLPLFRPDSMQFWSPDHDPDHPLLGVKPERYVLLRLNNGRYIAIDPGDQSLVDVERQEQAHGFHTHEAALRA
ncbi:MAG: hypothetical protein ACKOBY_01950, partial [Cyanobium sp.]